jgi:parallel beta-helix repeat protein
MTKTRDLADLGGGFIQAGTGAQQRTVESKLQDVVSVKDFGAVGDGVADDTAAIQAAIDSGKAAFVPKGVYKISATLNLNNGYKALIGDSSIPVINKTTAGSAIRIGTTSGAVLNEYSTVKNLYLKSLTVDPTFPVNPTANDAGIALDGSSSTLPAAVQRATVYNVRIGNWSVGVYTNDVVGCTIEKCVVQLLKNYNTLGGLTSSNKFCGYLLECTPFAPGSISPQASIELVQCDVGAAAAPTSATSIGYYCTGEDIRDIFMSRCESSYATYGFYVTSTSSTRNWDIQLTRPIVDQYKTHGIFIQNVDGAASVTINGGYFVGNATSAACVQIANSSGVTVTGGVQILGLTNSSSTDEGVRLLNSESCSVIGNNFLNVRYGISLDNSSNCIVAGNHLSGAPAPSEANPLLTTAIRCFNAASGNTISSNAIKGYDAVDTYASGIVVNSGCLNNLLVGNVIDSATVTNLYTISDSSTMMLSGQAGDMEQRANVLTLRSTTSTNFEDSVGGIKSKVDNSDGSYQATGILYLQGNGAPYPIVFRNGSGTAIAKIDNSGNYTTGAP